MHTGSELLETWIPDGGFVIERRKLKTADGGEVGMHKSGWPSQTQPMDCQGCNDKQPSPKADNVRSELQAGYEKKTSIDR